MKFGLLQFRTTYLCICLVAEEVGFEPTVSFPTPVFKTGSFGRSDTPPCPILVESHHRAQRGGATDDEPFAQ